MRGSRRRSRQVGVVIPAAEGDGQPRSGDADPPGLLKHQVRRPAGPMYEVLRGVD